MKRRTFVNPAVLVPVLASLYLVASDSSPALRPAGMPLNKQHKEVLHYGVEWRLVRAGIVRMEWNREASQGNHSSASLLLQSAGLVAKLYKVNNQYSIDMIENFFAASSLMKTEEGNRRKEARVTYHATQKKAEFLETDLVKKTVSTKETEIPGQVHDLIGGLFRLRGSNLKPGSSVEIPICDGKKFVRAKVEAQERETVRTPAGSFQTVRYEAFLFNNVMFNRKGNLYVWITDDEQRIPVQVRVRLPFYIGTITLQLEKQERS